MKYAVIFFCLLVIGVTVLTIIYRQGYYWKNVMLPAKKLYIPKKIDIVNTGSTFAKYDFDYQLLQMNGLNLALESQYFVDDFKMLKSYQDMIPEKTPVLITLAPGIFNVVENTRKNYLDKYYFVVKKEYIDHYNFLRKIILNSPLSWMVNISGLKGSIIELAAVLTGRNKKVKSKRELAQSRVNIWKEQFQMDITGSCDLDEKQEIIFEKTRKELVKIIELCIQNKWRPYLLIIPISKYENALLSEQYKELCMYQNIRLANKYRIPVFDYWKNTDYDEELFFNADCLNEKGRKKFLTNLMKKLSQDEIEVEKRE